MEGLLRKVFRQLRQGVNSILEKEISRNEFFMLKALGDGPLRASELSRILEVSASHITSMSDSLVEKRLIERKRDLTDRRMLNIAITQKGQDKLQELDEKKTNYLFQRFESLDEEELQTLVGLFKKLDSERNE
ncbi:MarR family transcriptional regulator [Bacillus mangrovi]|uniref:MarR family transcriptional regulator n=2 Tax=Metabacillus mangrovi TaxID=1491830 RepID=A0A7X2S294_9BACI|nr:MarR family transcriptional regulator [Metabacillus mangrovi]MTH52057.1 MarR family transcriptional regulator [Metabacillus mangrovi]